jgi:hypothetical protein
VDPAVLVDISGRETAHRSLAVAERHFPVQGGARQDCAQLHGTKSTIVGDDHREPRPRGAADDSALARKFRSEARSFFREWRKQWYRGFRDTANNKLRDAAGHCHGGGTGNRYPPNFIGSGATAKAMCPHWYPYAALQRDERQGIDAALTNEARVKIRDRRASLLALLDTALAAMPTNVILHGQRVRFAVDQRDSARAERALTACPGLDGWCDMLGVYVAAQLGDLRRADSLVDRALAAMRVTEQCEWGDLSAILQIDERSNYRRRDCAARRTVNANFWWLADPLWSQPGNERRAVHFARLMEVTLRSELAWDERFDWTPRLGGLAYSQMIIRYGWPSLLAWLGRLEDDGHRSYLGYDDQAVTTLSPEYIFPRAHTTPPLNAAVSPSVLARDDWRDMGPRWNRDHWNRDWWAFEHMPLDGGPMVVVSDQTATFRRTRHALAAVATQMPEWAMARARGYNAWVVYGESPDSAIAATTPLPSTGRIAMTVPAPSPGIVSIELVSTDRYALVTGRSRYAVIPLSALRELPRGELALSDIALFDAESDTRAPASLEAMLPRMLPSTEVARGSRLGVFWETYGLAKNEAVTVRLRVQRDDRSMLSRLSDFLGVGGDPPAVDITWREPRADLVGSDFLEGDIPVQTRAITLGLAALQPGDYTVSLTITRTGAPAAVSMRSLVIRDNN